MALFSLVYVSVSDKLMTDSELKAILDVARTNNARDQITGMLLYRSGYFIQVLEGEEEAVMRTYNKILLDSRHFNCLIVYKNQIAELSFDRWSMGFNHLEQIDPSASPEVKEFMAHPFEPSHLTAKPTIAVHLLESFRDQNTF